MLVSFGLLLGLLLQLSAAGTLSQLEARLEALERENAAIKAELQVRASASPASRELRMFLGSDCPSGWVESNATKGYVLVGRPKHATAGQQLNAPLAAGEAGRVGAHVHTTIVSDPGHRHSVGVAGTGSVAALTHVAAAGTSYANVVPAAGTNVQSNVSKTGIQVEAAEMAHERHQMEVEVQQNAGSGHLPLVYVFMCEKL